MKYIIYRIKEVDLVTSLFDLLYSFKLRQDGEDKICWIPSKRRRFEVRSLITCCALSLALHSLEEHLEI
jgi:hypothetical protein